MCIVRLGGTHGKGNLKKRKRDWGNPEDHGKPKLLLPAILSANSGRKVALVFN